VVSGFDDQYLSVLEPLGTGGIEMPDLFFFICGLK
jgi:hypothetical protein